MADLSASEQPARRLYAGLLALCIAGTLALAMIAAIPEETFRQSLVLVDRDASRHFLTPNQLFVVKAGAAGSAAMLLAAVALFLVARGRTLGYLARLAADWQRFRERLREDLQLPDKRDGVALGVIVLVGFALRLYGLEHPWRFDESDSLIHFVRLDWFNLWTDYTQPNNHIFYNFLAHFSDAALGGLSGASRLPAFVAGLLIVPALFFAGRMLFGTQAALAATAVAASFPPLVDFSTNARGYGLVTLLLLASIIAANSLHTRRSISAWAVISILMTASLFTVPTALFGFGTLLLLTLLSAERVRRGPLLIEAIACTAFCGFASILLYTPPAMRGTWAVIVGNPFVQPMSWDQMMRPVANYLALLWVPLQQPSLLLSAAIAAAALYAGARTPGGRRVLVAVFLPAVVLCAAGRFMPPPRVWLYALPLIILAAAAGPVGVRRNVARAATATCLLLAVGLSFARESMPGFELRFYGQVQQIADEMAPQLDPTDAVIVPTPMSDPLQLRLLENDSRLGVCYDPRDLKAGRRTLDGRSKVWVVRPRPDSYLGWENGRREYDLSQPYLTVFAEPRHVATTEHLEVWVMSRR